MGDIEGLFFEVWVVDFLHFIDQKIFDNPVSQILPIVFFLVLMAFGIPIVIIDSIVFLFMKALRLPLDK